MTKAELEQEIRILKAEKALLQETIVLMGNKPKVQPHLPFPSPNNPTTPVPYTSPLNDRTPVPYIGSPFGYPNIQYQVDAEVGYNQDHHATVSAL